MVKNMEQELKVQEISTSLCSDEKTTIPPVDAGAKDSQTYCIHHPYFWDRMREDILILRDVLVREKERRMKRAFENAFVDMDIGNEENTSMKILKFEDVYSMSAKATNNNKKEEEEQDGGTTYSGDEECEDIMVLDDDEINELAPSFIDPQQHDWISEIRSSFKPCNLCLRDYGSEA